MKILFIGDVFSELGRQAIKLYLPSLKKSLSLDLVIANGENVTHGHGINKAMYDTLLSLGVDVITLGNHFLAPNEGINFFNQADKLVRPANIYDKLPGSGSKVFEVNGTPVRITNILGQVFIDALNPTNPFWKIDEIISDNTAPIHIVDFHGEATAEKLSFGWYVDGKVSAVLGTHTHVPTADERIFPQGTGYISDVGMCGAYDGIIGLRRDLIINKAITGLKAKNEMQTGSIQFCAVLLDIDEQSGKTREISRIMINPDKTIGV